MSNHLNRRAAFQRLSTMGGPGADTKAQIDELLATATAALAEGDLQQAGGIYQELIAFDPALAAAHAGLARVVMAMGGPDMAATVEQVLDQVPAEIAGNPPAVGSATPGVLRKNVSVTA